MDIIRNYPSQENSRGTMANTNKDMNIDKSQVAASAMNFNTPPQMTFNTEEFRGSMQQILSENIGEFVVIEFLIGTQFIVRKQGILQHVGVSFITLYDDQLKNFIVCDLFSIKFVTFYFPGDRPKRNYNQTITGTTGSTNGSGNGNNGNIMPR